MRCFINLTVIALALAGSAVLTAQPALQQLLNDTAPADHWFYDDYASAAAKAKETGKPLLVLFR